MKHDRMTLLQAYHYVKAARPIIRPNVGFFRQMVDFERKLRGELYLTCKVYETTFSGHASVVMVKIDGCDLPVPDIYANELRRQVAYRSALSASSRDSDDLSAQRAKSAALPIDYIKSRRGLSVG